MSRSSRQALIGLGGMAVVLFAIAFLAAGANHRQGLRVDVLSARRTEPGTVETFTISVRDTSGKVRSVSVDFGDGPVERLDVADQRCVEPMTRTFDATHAYEFTGYSTVEATVVTGGCGSKTEKVQAIRTIQIRPVRR
ncbi:MAG TPA: hypothetical protein VM143_05360 [Acidimicrobiales bacterium]|nr:hypothetical protein [Acidimicrobiales bacterium]